jgi:preprotein translocase subunit SecD
LKFSSKGAQFLQTSTKKMSVKFSEFFSMVSPISLPVIQEAIPDGTAVISGGFTRKAQKSSHAI